LLLNGRLSPTRRVPKFKRSDAAKAFIVLPKRWIVERTIGWLNRCRRFGQGLGMSELQLNTPHVAKALSLNAMISNGL
jgi:hypothetical protein